MQGLEHWPTDKLIDYARNPRKNDHAVDRVSAAIKEFGFRVPIIAKSDGLVVDGHLRLKAAKKLGIVTVPVLLADDLSPAQIKAFRLSVNKMAELADWDDEMLAVELTDLKDMGFDLDLTGFSTDEIEALLAPVGTEGLTDEDAVPEVPEAPVTVLGDVWLLGKHRVMCGDCRDFALVEKVMNGVKINVAITSPPYASQRKYDESSGFKPISPNDYVDWYQDVAANIIANLQHDGSYFCNIKPNAEELKRELYVFDLVLAHVRDWGWNFAEEFCWERAGIPQQVARRFKNQFEPIYHFTKGEWKFRPEAVKHESKAVPKALGKGAGDTNAAKRQGHVSAIYGNDIAAGMAYPGNRLPTFQSAALGHPAAYPVGLPEFFIKAYSDEGDVVYDPFMGSGSTLIAAEKNGRIACGLELSPKYVDLIICRWQEFTGQTATLESDGKPFISLKKAA